MRQLLGQGLFDSQFLFNVKIKHPFPVFGDANFEDVQGVKMGMSGYARMSRCEM